MEKKFENIIENYFNGNYSDVKRLFNRLKNDDKLTFITYVTKGWDNNLLSSEDIIDILSFLLRKRIDG